MKTSQIFVKTASPHGEYSWRTRRTDSGQANGQKMLILDARRDWPNKVVLENKRQAYARRKMNGKEL